MDKLSQVRGVLRGIRNIAVQGIYTDTFKGMEAQCVSTYRKCIATLKTVPDFEEIESLAPDLTDSATMQEIGFAVETVLSLISEGAGPVTGKGMQVWMGHGGGRARTCHPARPIPPVPPAPPLPSLPPLPPMPHAHGPVDKHAWRDMKRHMKQQFRAFRHSYGVEHSRRLEELQDEMQEKIEAEQERFEESVESIEEQMEELQEKIEELRERLEERLEEIREKYEEKIERIQEAAEEPAELAEEEEEEHEEECECDEDEDDDDDDDDDDPEVWLER
ncbi:MAG: hypothetical protein ACM3WU_00345 [Bacillota bacterium]